jgi:cytoskeleton protein RodZ
MNAVSEIQPTVGIAGSTPGALLRQEREQRGLTVQQVSEELHLDAWLVEALEQNRFLALGAPVYAKGHLRKYAVLLGLSPELVLARYQEIAEPPPPLQLPPREALLMPDPIARGFDLRRFAVRIDWRGVNWRRYGIIGGVLVLAAGSWLVANVFRTPGNAPQVAQDTLPRTTPDTTETTSQTISENPPSATQSPVATTPLQPAPAATLPKPVQANTPAPATKPVTAAVRPVPTSPRPKAEPPKVAAPPSASVEPRVAAARPLPAPPKSVTTPAAPPKPAANPSAAVPSAATPSTAQEIPQVSLRLEFAVASWAEVYDGDGRRLLYAVGDPSRARTISGKPPLKVTLGQAGSVQARVNGRPIAIPRRIGQESASFTIGPNGSIR